MSAVARLGVVADNYGLDPKLQQGQLTKTDTADAARAVWNVARDSSNPVEAVSRLTRMALAGKRFFSGFSHSAHYVVEGHGASEIKSKLKLVRETMRPHGTEIANTVPTVLRSCHSFRCIPSWESREKDGCRCTESWPFPRWGSFGAGLMAMYEENAERMKEFAEWTRGAMFMTINSNAFLYEPVFYWEDSQTVFHKRFMPKDYLATLPEHEENPQGRALVKNCASVFWISSGRLEQATCKSARPIPTCAGASRSGAPAARRQGHSGSQQPHESRGPGASTRPEAEAPCLQEADCLPAGCQFSCAWAQTLVQTHPSA